MKTVQEGQHLFSQKSLQLERLGAVLLEADRETLTRFAEIVES